MANEFPLDLQLLADSPDTGRSRLSPDPFDLGLVTGDKAADSEDRTACTCAICGKVFNSVWYLKQHAVKHSSERPFRCKHCQKTYRFRSNLYQHKCPHREKTEANGTLGLSKSREIKIVSRLSTNFDCSTFAQSSGQSEMDSGKELIANISQAEVEKFLERHREKLHKCAKCRIYFPTREYLQQHTAWHNNDAKLKCLHCSESFDDELSYANHKTFHTPQSPHVCPNCGGKFAHRLALKKHLVRCTNAPPPLTNNWNKVMDRSPVHRANSPAATAFRDSPADENPSSVGSAPSLSSTNGSRSSGQDPTTFVPSQVSSHIQRFSRSVENISPNQRHHSAFQQSAPDLVDSTTLMTGMAPCRNFNISRRSLKLTNMTATRSPPLHLLNRLCQKEAGSFSIATESPQCDAGLAHPNISTASRRLTSVKRDRKMWWNLENSNCFVCANCGVRFNLKADLRKHLSSLCKWSN